MRNPKEVLRGLLPDRPLGPEEVAELEEHGHAGVVQRDAETGRVTAVALLVGGVVVFALWEPERGEWRVVGNWSVNLSGD